MAVFNRKQEKREALYLNLKSTSSLPKFLVVNWQAGKFLMVLQDGTTIEAHSGPNSLSFEWPDSGVNQCG